MKTSLCLRQRPGPALLGPGQQRNLPLMVRTGVAAAQGPLLSTHYSAHLSLRTAAGRPTLLTVAKSSSSSDQQLAEYRKREEFLLAELSAVRRQVDKLLEQQQMLLSMLAAQSVQSGSKPTAASQPAPVALPSTLGTIQGPATPPASPQTSASSSSSTKTAPAPSKPSPPKLDGVSELQKILGRKETDFDSSAANAINSIQAAMAAVNDSDVLSDSFVIGSPAALTASVPAKPAESSAVASSAAPQDVETVKAPHDGNPPELTMGDDDIYWMSKLHDGLVRDGFFPGDADLEDWYFGEGTLQALLAFQACNKLPETGVVDAATWSAILGKPVEATATSPSAPSPGPTADPASSMASFVVSSGDDSDRDSTAATLGSSSAPSSASTASSASLPSSSVRLSSSVGSASSTDEVFTEWPVLMEMDGGRAVHALQVALTNKGYFCGDDDMQWWQFGTTTQTALKFYQASIGLPESGVADKRTWLSLLGEDAQPQDIVKVRPDDSDDEVYSQDLGQTSQGRVWLLGEGRWETRT